MWILRSNWKVREGSSGDDSDTSGVQEDESSDSVNIL